MEILKISNNGIITVVTNENNAFAFDIIPFAKFINEYHEKIIDLKDSLSKILLKAIEGEKMPTNETVISSEFIYDLISLFANYDEDPKRTILVDEKGKLKKIHRQN
jgi:hypothetical protein